MDQSLVSPSDSNHKTPSTSRNDKFLDCMAHCLGKSVGELVEIYEECHSDVECWAKKIGVIALKCVPQCIGENKIKQKKADNTPVSNNEEIEEIPELLLTRPDLTEPLKNKNLMKTPADGNKFIKCMAKCLSKSISQIEQWYNECKTDVKCWEKKVGFAALKCVPQCISFEDLQKTDGLYDVTKKNLQSNAGSDGNKFVKCMAKCLSKSISQIEQWYNECKTDVKCWEKKVGFAALKCVPQCIKIRPKQMESNGVLVCLAECVKKVFLEIYDIYNQCHTDVQCWVKTIAGIAIGCVGDCLLEQNVKLPIVSKPTLPDPKNDEFLDCMAHCLGKSVDELIEIYEECHTDVECWAKKIGVVAFKCVSQCIGENEIKQELLVPASVQDGHE